MSFLNPEKRDRTKFIGGSDIGIIMGTSPYKSAYQLWLEKTGRVSEQDISALPHVQRGILGEPRALAKLAEITGDTYQSHQVFKAFDICACEVDAMSMTQSQIVEIKCMSKEVHESVSRATIPEHYLYQCQWNMALAGAVQCLFVSYRPEDDTVVVIPVEADEKLQSKLIMTAKKWWEDHVVADEPPEFTDLDFVDMSDNAEMAQMVDSYKELYTEIKEKEKALEDYKKKLKMMLNGMKRVKVNGVSLTHYPRKGNVNYSKIPELKGVDLEPYRNKPSEVFMIKV